MGSATSAGHMVASRDALYGSFTAWAALYVMVLGPGRKEDLMLLLELRTDSLLMTFEVTAWTYTNKAGWAL